MGYKALVTLDLQKVTQDQRDTFYQSLTDDKWSKLDDLTTAWKATFKDEVTRSSAIEVIHNDLKRAKDKAKVARVDYATQLDKINLVHNHL